MTWHNTATRSRRMAVTWILSGTNPVEVSIGPEHAEFWATVQSDGYDIVAATAAGADVKCDRSAWSYASKTATFQLEATSPFAAPAGAVVGVLYLYWKAASTIAMDPSSSVTGSMQTGRAVPVDWKASPLTAIITGITPEGGTSTPVPVETVPVPVGASRVALVPVDLATLADGRLVGGGPTLEDVAGLDVDVLDADANGDPTTPANWLANASIRLVTALHGGVAVLATLTPDEAVDATLRVRAYLVGPASGSLPDRVASFYARVRGITPQEA